jgi:hypothetical protein
LDYFFEVFFVAAPFLGAGAGAGFAIPAALVEQPFFEPAFIDAISKTSE